MPKRIRAKKATQPKQRTVRPELAAVEEPIIRSEYALDDQAVIRALRTGQYRGLLQDLFGPDAYDELVSLVRDAERRQTRGGEKVLVVPGIMGSKLGVPRFAGLVNDVYWIDPIDISMGKLSKLKYPDGDKNVRAVGVILITYLKIWCRLRIAGYDAEFYPYDWRKSIKSLGAEFRDALANAGGERVSIVAHSMGGLVSRSAIGQGAKYKRLIMLGTPNNGSFAPIAAYRGTNSMVKWIALLDAVNKLDDLLRDVFATVPGLAEMLPFPSVCDTTNFYKPASWPKDGKRPTDSVLKGAAASHAVLAKGDSRKMTLIAGVNQSTITDAWIRNGEFEFAFSPEGDGTVPLAFAKLPGVPTYYIEEAHGSLPNNRTVQDAVIEILQRGSTSQLDTQYVPPPARRAPVVERESALRAAMALDKHRGLGKQEMRNILREFAAPDARECVSETSATPEPGAALAPAAVLLQPGPFNQLTIRRKLQRRLEIVIARGDITAVEARAVVLGLFANVAPTGPARAMDERIGGAIRDLVHRRMFSGNVGELFVLPTPRRQIHAEFLIFAGLGSFDRFDGNVLTSAADNLVRMLSGVGVEELATVMLGVGSGLSVPAALQQMLKGFIRGLAEADPQQRFRRITLCESDLQRIEEIRRALVDLTRTDLFEGIELVLHETDLPQPLPMAGPARAAGGADPAYLLVRQNESDENSTITLEVSLLPTDSKAAIVSGRQTVARQEYDAVIRAVIATKTADFSEAGAKMGDTFLPAEVREVLSQQRSRSLIVVHDAPSARVPWEALQVPGPSPWFPAVETAVSRLYTADNLSVAKWLQSRVANNVLEVLLVINPTNDLPGAAREGEVVHELLKGQPGAHIEKLVGSEATHAAVFDAFGSGRFDIIHFAGHGFFNAVHPGRSGIRCHGYVPLTGNELATLSVLPPLVFFNACEVGRVRGGKDGGLVPAKYRSPERLEAGVGAAEAFMRGGVANFIGPYWPVSDFAATEFASVFYPLILEGKSVGEAVLAGRKRLRETNERDWANYISYGSPDFVLKA